MLNKLKDFTITRKEKAVTGAVVAAVTAYLSESGLTLDQIFTKNGLYALLVGVATHLVVYWTPNTQ